MWQPQRHAAAVKVMLERHRVNAECKMHSAELKTRQLDLSDLKRFVAGADVLSRQRLKPHLQDTATRCELPRNATGWSVPCRRSG